MIVGAEIGGSAMTIGTEAGGSGWTWSNGVWTSGDGLVGLVVVMSVSWSRLMSISGSGGGQVGVSHVKFLELKVQCARVVWRQTCP